MMRAINGSSSTLLVIKNIEPGQVSNLATMIKGSHSQENVDTVQNIGGLQARAPFLETVRSLIMIRLRQEEALENEILIRSIRTLRRRRIIRGAKTGRRSKISSGSIRLIEKSLGLDLQQRCGDPTAATEFPEWSQNRKGHLHRSSRPPNHDSLLAASKER